MGQDVKKLQSETSHQDGGIGRHTLPPRTTKSITNLKTENTQNCQKIELYGNPTTKELKKHSSRWVGGGWRKAARVQRTHSNAGAGQAAAGRAGGPHSRAGKQQGATGEQDRLNNPGF